MEYVRVASLALFLTILFNTYIFVVCILRVIIMQSLKKIYAWAQMQDPLKTILYLIFFFIYYELTSCIGISVDPDQLASSEAS